MPRSIDKFPEKRGAGAASLNNPLRSQLDWESALGDTTKQAGEKIRGAIDGAIDQVIEFIYEETGLDLSVLSEIITSLPGGGNPMDELGAFFDALRAFFPFDLNAPSFDPAAAAVAFIQNMLTPQGLLAELAGGKLKSGQEPQLLLNIKDAVGGGLNSTIVAIENRLQFLGTSGQFPAAQLFGGIAAGLISGVLAAAQVPLLDASKIGSGTLGTGLIPVLDASKIGSGVFGTGLIPNLDAGKITSGTLLGALIPGLDASKIVSGSLGDGIVPGLGLIRDAIGQAIDGGSTTGYTPAQIKAKLQAFPGANIAGSIAATLLSGVIGAAQIPGLDASKIISGQFGSSAIPDLDAAKIITGTLVLARIPGLPAGQITSGVFGAGLIPGLDASKITSGQFPQSMLNITSIPGNIITGTVAGVQALQDSIWQAFGGSGSGSTTNVASVINNYQTRITALEGGGTLTSFGANGTWTNPTPTEHKPFIVRTYGGGAGGGKNTTTTGAPAAKGGLGGGCEEKTLYTDEVASSVAITVGAATAGATASGGVPAAGAVSKFGSYVQSAPDTGDLNLKPGRGGNGANMQGANGMESPEYGEGNRYVSRSAPGAGTTAGTAGASAPSGTSCGGAGGGGGGGQSGSPVTGAAGGNGGTPGGGGGGGGRGGTNIGNGGNGGAGRVDVITF
ncbi:hypothetical protein MSTE_03548 [Mycobacteroides stephanolepidis]|uniref:Uncharacterized protein n=1 Tax=[Mycobacterium] stephanolepidis TaxID=1520670 RepID=A0A1Z4F0Y1_9MYCO|nr:hypothetical protein [[Mycobacterium] stephanolepidis]BAX98848.1 hypothetical protein MSTE_03548 [[Mycobacterium] stephanolepidis]